MGMLADTVSVRFRGPSYDISLTLYSKYTSIFGKDSGVGKTWLFDTLQRHQNTEQLVIESMYPVVFPEVGDLLDVLARKEKTIVFVDEPSTSKNKDLQVAIQETHHFIVSIGRDVHFRLPAALQGIYEVSVLGDTNFQLQEINHDSKLPITKSLEGVDVVVTESSAERSEHALISALCTRFNKQVEFVPAEGKDKIEKKLRWLTGTVPNAKIVVFTDLSNISSQFRLLTKRCQQNSNISFYPWDSFEELLCKCEFVRSNWEGEFKKSSFEYLTLERFYEVLIEECTKGKPYCYSHNTPKVKKCYYMECVDCKECEIVCKDKLKSVLDNEVGKQLYEFFSSGQEVQQLNMF